VTTAAVVHRSRTGTTRRYAEEIGAFLRSRGIETTVVSIADADLAALAQVDLLLLGCWTNGLMIVLQHPDGPWESFARALPALTMPKVGLFTTYRLATGSMFRKMREALGSKAARIDLELRSRDGLLSDADRAALDALVASAATRHSA
jgi:flavodoxin